MDEPEAGLAPELELALAPCASLSDGSLLSAICVTVQGVLLSVRTLCIAMAPKSVPVGRKVLAALTTMFYA